VINWEQTIREYGQAAADESLKSLLTRLRGKCASDGMVGRWSADVLAMIVETDPRAAAALTSGTDAEFSGHSRSDPGEALIAGLEVRSALIGRARGIKPTDFYPQIGKQISALSQ
jgi:GGDEF domain-containing protein